MKALPGLRRLFRLATGRATYAADLAEELSLHLDLLTEELIGEGMDPVAARREAERRFGDPRRIGKTVHAIDVRARRDSRRKESMQRLMHDIRIAARTLLRQPAFALGGVLIVALGIGAATAMFTVLNAAFLKPFAYPDADRMMYVWERSKTGGRMAVAGPNAIDWSAETRLFPTLAYFSPGQAVLSSAGQPEYLKGAAVSRPFAAVLGLNPLMGRWFSEEEARKGGPPVVVISENLWRRRFGADAGLIGRSITLDGAPAVVVGIMPRGFEFPTGSDLWQPAEPHNDGTSRTAHNWRVVARLAPGAERAVVERDLSALTRRLVENEKGGEDFIATGAMVIPFREQLIGDSRTVLLLLQGAVLLVLLIAAVNLTNLTLARAVRRQGEVGVCLALGAHRADIIRRFATENLLITLTGGVAGLILAGVLRGLMGRWIGRMLPFVKDLPLDRRVAGFALALAVLVGLASSLAPAWRASGGLMGFTVSRGGTIGRSSRRLIDTLMGAEVALAVVLVSGAGLLGRSLLRLSGVDPGFAFADRAAVLVPLRTGAGSPTPTALAVTQAYDRLLDEVRARPGTIAAAATSALPFWSDNPNGSAEVEGTPSANGGPPAVSDFRIAGPDYFRTVEIPVRKGREFQESDIAGSPYVAIVNEAFVRKHLGGGDPLGRRVRFPGMDADEDPWATIVGVVGDNLQYGFASRPEPAIYYSYRQRSGREITLVVHSTQPVGAVLGDLKARLVALDPNLPFTGKAWADVMDDSLALPRIRSVLLGLFAVIALVLSAAGIAAVVAFAVAQRTREIGLRIAVGASPGAITRNGVARTAAPVLTGLAVGVGAALFLGRLATTLLYGLAPGDPLTLSLAVAVTLAVAVVAAYVPARRATRVDPLIALRSE